MMTWMYFTWTYAAVAIPICCILWTLEIRKRKTGREQPKEQGSHIG